MRKKRSQRAMSMKSSCMMKWYRSKRRNKLNRKINKKLVHSYCMGKYKRWHLGRSKIVKLQKSSILNINHSRKKIARIIVSIKQVKIKLLSTPVKVKKAKKKKACRQASPPTAKTDLSKSQFFLPTPALSKNLEKSPVTNQINLRLQIHRSI